MASTFLLQKTDVQSDNPSWPDAWDQVSKVSMVALTLQGHEELLFKHHISFKEGEKYMKPPRMSIAFQFQSLAQNDQACH